MARNAGIRAAGAGGEGAQATPAHQPQGLHFLQHQRHGALQPVPRRIRRVWVIGTGQALLKPPFFKK